jgi:uncharacterized surface protein with fasciclin (FAS1) repeats
MFVKKIFVSLAVVGLIVAASCKKSKKCCKKKVNKKVDTVDKKEENSTIVDVAIADENFSTLVTALKTADLVTTLSGNDSFTVFAPTNNAFSKLPKRTFDSLLKSKNKSTLADILTYHVIKGKFDSTTAIEEANKNNGMFEITTLQGAKLKVTLEGENVILTDQKNKTATITRTDIEASNGIIHVIDNVLRPV